MDERYPIGEFRFDGDLKEELAAGWIKEIETLPSLLKNAVKDLTDEQLDTPYRNGGWTLRQVVHHIADASMNSYIRFKLAVLFRLLCLAWKPSSGAYHDFSQK